MFYILSLIITNLINKISAYLLNKKIENMGFVVKSKRYSKLRTIISTSLLFIPNLNILISILNIIICSIGLNNEKFLLKVTEELRYNPNDVIKYHNKRLIKKDELKDALILDGASEEQIKEEFNKLDTYIKYASKEKSWFGYTLNDSPIFNEYDINNAKSLELASEFLDEIESNIELTNKQKQKILALCKKEFLKDITGKLNESSKSSNKILKLVKND